MDLRGKRENQGGRGESMKSEGKGGGGGNKGRTGGHALTGEFE